MTNMSNSKLVWHKVLDDKSELAEGRGMAGIFVPMEVVLKISMMVWKPFPSNWKERPYLLDWRKGHLMNKQ